MCIIMNWNFIITNQIFRYFFNQLPKGDVFREMLIIEVFGQLNIKIMSQLIIWWLEREIVWSWITLKTLGKSYLSDRFGIRLGLELSIILSHIALKEFLNFFEIRYDSCSWTCKNVFLNCAFLRKTNKILTFTNAFYHYELPQSGFLHQIFEDEHWWIPGDHVLPILYGPRQHEAAHNFH